MVKDLNIDLSSVRVPGHHEIEALRGRYWKYVGIVRQQHVRIAHIDEFFHFGQIRTALD